ncbi:unnamed protein product, partial [marine sediment metagenome]
MGKKLNYQFVKNYFEEQNCTLLSTEYINNKEKLKYICSCGNEEAEITFCNFKSGQRCKLCGIEKLASALRLEIKYVRNFFKEQNCTLLSEYINSGKKLKYICLCGNVSEILYHDFKNGHRCMKCSGTPKYDVQEIFDYFAEQ